VCDLPSIEHIDNIAEFPEPRRDAKALCSSRATLQSSLTTPLHKGRRRRPVLDLARGNIDNELAELVRVAGTFAVATHPP